MTANRDTAGRPQPDKQQPNRRTLAEQLTDAVEALGVDDTVAALREIRERRADR